MGRRHLLITGRTGLGGTGSPAQGVVGTSCKALEARRTGAASL